MCRLTTDGGEGGLARNERIPAQQHHRRGEKAPQQQRGGGEKAPPSICCHLEALLQRHHLLHHFMSMEQNFRRGGDFPLTFHSAKDKTEFRKPTVLLFETTTDRPTDLLTHSIYQDRYCCTYPFEPKVDGEVRTIAIDVLKQLIGRLETEKNPMNIIPVGEAK